MNVTPITRAIAKPVAKRSVPLLLKSVTRSMSDHFMGSASNLTQLRRSAMMLSGAIQISSRILVANSTAARTRGTPEGIYRFQEAANTTFREIFSWAATYLMLLYAQRLIVDGFRSYLWIKSPVSFRPTAFLPMFQSIFRVPEAIRKEVRHKAVEASPGLITTVGRHINDFIKGSQKRLAAPLVPMLEQLKPAHINIDLLQRGQQYKALEGTLIDKLCVLAGKKPETMLPAEKLRIFFEWAPPVLGSIPAVILSGYCSETLTHKYARRFANALSRIANKQPEYPSQTNLKMQAELQELANRQRIPQWRLPQR